MTCEAALELLATQPEGLGPDGSQALKAHLAGCNACREVAEDLRALAGLAAGLPAPDSRPSPETLGHLARGSARTKVLDWLRATAAVAAGVLLTAWLAAPRAPERRIPVPDIAALRASLLKADPAPEGDRILCEIPSADPKVKLFISYEPWIPPEGGPS